MVSNLIRNLSNFFNPGRTISYPEDATIRDREGFLLEVIHSLCLKLISQIKHVKLESSCDSSETWKDNTEIHYDHDFGEELHESKNWGTGKWKSRVSEDIVEREINDRFIFDDPFNEKNRVVVVSDVDGFLPSALKAIKGKLVTIGFKVNENNLWRAFRILLWKLAHRYDVWFELERIWGGVLTLNSSLATIFSHIISIMTKFLGPVLENVVNSGKGPPDSTKDGSIVGFLKRSFQSILPSVASKLLGGNS